MDSPEDRCRGTRGSLISERIDETEPGCGWVEGSEPARRDWAVGISAGGVLLLQLAHHARAGGTNQERIGCERSVGCEGGNRCDRIRDFIEADAGWEDLERNSGDGTREGGSGNRNLARRVRG